MFSEGRRQTRCACICDGSGVNTDTEGVGIVLLLNDAYFVTLILEEKTWDWLLSDNLESFLKSSQKILCACVNDLKVIRLVPTDKWI